RASAEVWTRLYRSGPNSFGIPVVQPFSRPRYSLGRRRRALDPVALREGQALRACAEVDSTLQIRSNPVGIAVLWRFSRPRRSLGRTPQVLNDAVAPLREDQALRACWGLTRLYRSGSNPLGIAVHSQFST